MSLKSHLAELERRHLAIDTKISTQERRPAADVLEIASLKKQKLSLKDEIERLRKETDMGRPN
ncbi:MAG: YdcH family protein [Devosiaceae bacterium]